MRLVGCIVDFSLLQELFWGCALGNVQGFQQQAKPLEPCVWSSRIRQGALCPRESRRGFLLLSHVTIITGQSSPVTQRWKQIFCHLADSPNPILALASFSWVLFYFILFYFTALRFWLRIFLGSLLRIKINLTLYSQEPCNSPLLRFQTHLEPLVFLVGFQLSSVGYSHAETTRKHNCAIFFYLPGASISNNPLASGPPLSAG